MNGDQERLAPWEDPIVAEVRKARETLLAEADYDLEKLSQRLRKEQITSGRQVVVRAPRHPNLLNGKAA